MMDSITARFEALLKNLGDIGVGINNVSVALGGYEMNIQNVVNVGGKLNQSFVALSRVTSLYGKTVNDLSSQTAALAQKFYLPYESLLSIQNKLASSLPVAITRQEQLNSVLSFAAERYGNTAQGVEGYIRVLEELSGKSQMLFEDQLLLIDAAENLRTAQQLGADAAKNATDAYARQASLTKENAQLMYLSGKIDRDTYASVVRSTQALDDQSKKMLQVAESGNRMNNEHKNSQTALLQLVASSSQFNEFYRGLQVVPGMLAASAMTAIGDLGSKLFDGDKLNTEVAEVRAAVNLFGQDLTAYMQKAAADGKSFDDAMQEIRADMEAAGGDAAKLFDTYTQQADVLQSMQGIFQGNSDKAHKMAVIQAQLLKLEKEGNQEALRSLQLNIAKEAANEAEMKTLDARNLFLREAVKQAEAYNKQTSATIALMAQQESVLALLQDAGESIGGIEERRSAQVRATLDGMSAEYQLLTQIADQRKAIADASDRLRGASGEDRRIAAANKIASIDSAIATARANMDAAGDEAVRNQISKQLEALENERQINDELFKNGQYDKMAQASAEYRAEAANAELEKQQKYNRNIDAMRQMMVQVAQDQGKFASLRASEAQAELSLLDSVASGIGASADMRAKAAAEQGKVVEATRNEIASEKQLIQDLQSQIAIQEQLARQAEESGNQSAAASAKQQIAMINAQIQKSELNITEARTKGMNALRTQLDITKQIREGYIDAISSMTEGAGVFAEIVVDQTKNLGVLLRTSKEMPTNLRTGSNTGPGAGISQFGAGGLMAGDFGPDIADYTNEIVSSQIPEIISSLDKIANRPVGDVASLNTNRLAEAVEAVGEGSTATQGAAKGGAPSGPPPGSPPPGRPAPSNPAVTTGAQPAPSSPAPQSSPAQQQTSANMSAPVTAAVATWGAKASQFLAQEEASRNSLMADLNRLATAQKVDFAGLIENMNKRLGAAAKGGEQAKIDEITQQNATLVAEIKKLQETAKKQLEQQKAKATAEAEQPATAGKQNQKESPAAAKPEPAAEKAASAQEGGMVGRMDGVLKQMADFSVAINSVSDNLGKIGGGEKSAQEQIAALREMLGGGSPVVSMAKSIYDILVPFVGKNQEINVVLQPPEPSAVAVNMPGAVNLSDEAIGYLSLLPDFMENLREIASLLSAKSPAPIVQVEAPAANSVGIRDAQADSMIALLSDLSKQASRNPSVPVELIVDILKAVRHIDESVAIKEAVSAPANVEVSVEQPQSVTTPLDISPLIAQIRDLQQLVASAEKSLSASAKMEQPAPVVNVPSPELALPVDMLNSLAQIEGLIAEIRQVIYDQTSAQSTNLSNLFASFKPAEPAEKEIGLASAPVVNLDVAAPAPVPIDLAPVAQAIEKFPQFPVETITDAVVSLKNISASIPDKFAVSPTVSVTTPAITIPPVDAAPIADSISQLASRMDISLADLASKIGGIKPPDVDVAVSSPQVNVESAPPALMPVDMGDMDANLVLFGSKLVSQLDDVKLMIDYVRSAQDKSSAPQVDVNVPPPQVQIPANDFSPITASLDSLTTSMNYFVGAMSAADQARTEAPRTEIIPPVEVESPAVNVELAPEMLSSMVELLRAIKDSSSVPAVIQVPEVKPEVTVSVTPPNLSAVQTAVEAIPQMPVDMISTIMSTVVSMEKSIASIPSQAMGGKIDVSLKSDQPDYKPDFQKLIDKFNIDFAPVVGAIDALSTKTQVQPQINVPPSEVVVDIPAAEPANAQVDVSSIAARLDDLKASFMSMFSDLSSASKATAESMPKLSDFVPDVNVDSAPIQIPAIDLSGIQSASSRGSELVVASVESAVNQFSQLQRDMIAAIAGNKVSVSVEQKPVEMPSIDLSGIKESADSISSRIQGMTEEFKATFSASISAIVGQVAEMPETKLLPPAAAPQQKESAQVVPKIGEDFTSGVSSLSEKVDKLVDKDMPSKFYDLMQKQIDLLGGMGASLASVSAVQVIAPPQEAVAAPQVEAAAVSPVAINMSELVSEISRLNDDMYMASVAGEQSLKESVGSLQADVSTRMAVISDLLLSISAGKAVGVSSEAGANTPSPTPIAPQAQGIQREDWSKIFPAIEVLQNNVVAALGGLGSSLSDSQKSVQNQQTRKPVGEVSDLDKISTAEEARQAKLLKVLDGVSGAVSSLLESSKSSASASQDSFKGISAILKDILNAARAVPQSNQGAAQQVAAAVDKAQKDNAKVGVEGEKAASEATGEAVAKKVEPTKSVQGESAIMSQGFVTKALEKAKTDANAQGLLANSKSKVDEIRTGFDSLNLKALGDKFDPSKADSSMAKDWNRAFSDLAMASGALELLMRSQGGKKTGDADSKAVSELVEMRNGLFSSLQQMQEAAKSGKVEAIDAQAVIRSVDLLSQKIVDQGTRTTAEKISPVEQAAKELDAIGNANKAFFEGVKTELSTTFKDKLNLSGMKYDGEGTKVVGDQLQQIFDQMGNYSASLDKYLSTVSVGEGEVVMQGKVDRVRQDFQNLIASLSSGELKKESINSGANFDLELIKKKFKNFQSDTFSELGIDFSKDFVPQLNDAMVKKLAPEGKSASQNDQGAAVETALKQAGIFGAIPQIMAQLVRMQAADQSGTEAVVDSVTKGADANAAATAKASQDNVKGQQQSSAQASANSAQAAAKSAAATSSSEAQVRKSIEAAAATEAARNVRISQEIEKSKQQPRGKSEAGEPTQGLRDDAKARAAQSSREAEAARNAEKTKSPAGATKAEKDMERAVSSSQAKPLLMPNIQGPRTPEEIEAIRATREQLKTQDAQREALEGMYRKITSSMVDMTLGGESQEKIDAFQGLANQISAALKQNKSSMMTDESIETISRARRMSERAFAGLEGQFGALPVRGSSRSIVSANPVRDQEMNGIAVPNASRGGSAPATQQGSAPANAVVTSVNFGESVSRQFADITRREIVPEIMKGMAAGMHEAFSV